MDKNTPKEQANQWRRRSWWNLKRANPIKHKAVRMRQSLYTWKVKNAPNANEIYRKLLKTNLCPFCFKSMSYEEINWDHIIPKYDGGPNTMENLQFCCVKCNQMKGPLNATEFKELIAMSKREPRLMELYERRIKPSLAYFNSPGRKIKYSEDCKGGVGRMYRGKQLVRLANA